MLFELLDRSLIPNIMRTPNDQNDTLGSKNEKHSLIFFFFFLKRKLSFNYNSEES